MKMYNGNTYLALASYNGGSSNVRKWVKNVDTSDIDLFVESIPYKETKDGLFTADGPSACSKLISATCDSGAKILNLTKFDDVVLRNNRVEGAVINWSPVSALPRQITCVDPIALESKVVIDATGHDAWVAKSLEKRGLLKIQTYGPMDVNTSEDMVVEKTGEIFPGLFAIGMAVSTIYGIPRMGPTFAGMLFSGRKAAQEIIQNLSCLSCK